LGPDQELLGVVVHSGLVLGRSKDVVVAIRRITAFPGGLALDTVVLARDIHAEPPVGESRRLRPTDGLRKRPSGRTRPRPNTTARPRPSGKAAQRPNGTMRCSRP
jgi:hypothetical protein